MFLCYGQEEFFDCRDVNFNMPLNFSDMLEQRHRRLTREEVKRAQLEQLASGGGDNFTSKSITAAGGSDVLLGVNDGHSQLD